MSEQPTRSLTDDAQDALANALMKHEQAMLGPWVLIAQSTAVDGSRGVWSIEARGCLRYEVLGLLNHALAEVNASYVFADDDEGES